MPDFIPNEDVKFDIFQEQFIEEMSELIDADPGPGKPGNRFPSQFREDFDEHKDLQKSWKDAWKAAKDKSSRRPKDVVDKDGARAELETFLRQFIREWVANYRRITNGERAAMGVPVPDAEPSPHPQIVDPIIGLTHKAGGDVELRCRVTSDATMASKPLAHILVQAKHALVGANDPNPGFEQCILIYESSKALSMMHFGVPNVGKRLYIYMYAGTTPFIPKTRDHGRMCIR